MRIGAAGIIIKDKRILLLKRSNYTKAFPKHWTMPGGRGDKGETPEQIVIREVKEETNLEFIPNKLFQSNLIERAGEKISTNRFLGSFSGIIQVQEEEVDGFAWYTYDETLNLKVAFDYPDILKKLNEEGYL